MQFLKTTKTYTISEFMEVYKDDREEYIKILDKAIGHIEKNTEAYFKLVFIIANLIHYSKGYVYANNLEESLDVFGNKMVEIFLSFAAWGCAFMGLKNMTITLMNGGNVKDAINDGISYAIAFLFLQVYPQVYVLLRDIKF